MMINQDYFIKYLKNELTEKETRELLTWIKEKKENQDFLFSLKESYVYLNYENDCKGADTEREWQKFIQRTGLSQKTKTTHKNKKISYKRFFLNAAAVLIVAIVSWQTNTYFSNNLSTEDITVETKAGQQAKTILPDGSTILLNACSKLTYSLKKWQKTRSIQLEGEAIFDVKHKKNEPFYVQTKHYNIRVLGTNFNVSSYTEEKEDIVTLKKGKVEINIEGTAQSTTLIPGESFIYNNYSGTYKIEKRPLTQIYAWEQKEIIFEGHTLEDKKNELFRHFEYNFLIAPEIQNISFKATLRDESLNEFLSLLCTISPQISYSIDTNYKTVNLFKTKKTD